jgi:type I restriction enzyme, S subunit
MSEGLSGWQDYLLGEIAKVQTGPFGSQLHMSDYKMEGVPIITVEHLGENKIFHNNLPLVGDADRKRLIKYTLQEGDIVFSRVGSVDRRAYVSANEDGWMFSGRCLRVRANKDIIEPRFLSYYFGQESFKETIRRTAVGATMPSINTAILSETQLSIPPFSAQTRIAAVLSSLDDKIDLLYRQNKTLESMAETLFRQWFIEEAQEEWADTTLDCHSHVMRGLSYKGSGLSDSGLGIPMHNLNSIYEGGGYKEFGIKYYTAEFKERHLVRNGEIIVANTEQGHEFRLIGYPAVIPSFYGEKGLFSQHIYRLILKENSYLTTIFLYYLLMTPNVRELIISATNGSTVNMLAIDGLQRPKFKLPPKEKVVEFSGIVKSWWEKKDVNHLQLRTLEKLRDTLLPKLMSGEVRVAV